MAGAVDASRLRIVGAGAGGILRFAFVIMIAEKVLKLAYCHNYTIYLTSN